jgi:hypothetical protein
VARPELRVVERDEVAPVRELRVVVDVSEVLHGHGFDSRGLECIGALDR